MHPSGSSPAVRGFSTPSGHRASLFGLGALLYLADAGKNQEVRSIASVSGGSLTNGVVAQSLRYHETLSPSFEEAMRPFAARIASAGTFMNAPLKPPFSRLLVGTFVVAAGGGWFVPTHRGLRLLIACGLIALWAILVLSHVFATRLGQLYGVVLATTVRGGGGSLARADGRHPAVRAVHRAPTDVCALALRRGERRLPDDWLEPITRMRR